MRLSNLRTLNTDYMNLPAREAVLYWTIIAGVVAVFAMDIVFAAPTAQYFAHRYLAGLHRLAALAPCVLPAVVICIELMVGARRAYASEALQTGSLVGWTIFACLLTVLMPALSAATQLTEPSHLRTPAFWMRTAAICGFSLVLHGVICFSGDFIHRAKSYVTFATAHRVLNARTDAVASRVRNENRGAMDAFTLFLQARVDAGRNQDPVPPFDADVRRELELGFGQPVVPGPVAASDGRGPQQGPQTPPADPTPAGAGEPTAGNPADAADGEVDYLRRVLAAQVREADARVTA